MEDPKEHVDLDEREGLSKIDVSGMLDALEDFPDQVRQAVEIARDTKLPSGYSGIENVVFLGMGGSGISGDIVSAIAFTQSAVPFLSVKGYGLPGFVGSRSLVFAVSYSGNTEETLFSLEEAIRRDSMIIGITSGGKLLRVLEERGLVCYRIPEGFQPRAALGYLCVPMIVTLERLKVLEGIAEKVSRAADLLEHRRDEYGPGCLENRNPVKHLARGVAGYLPVVYGSEGYLSTVALRWKTQINENAKLPSFSNSFPELNHNETVGWKNLKEICGCSHLIVLRSEDECVRNSRRISITSDLISGSVGRLTQVWARGNNEIERMFDLIYFGDFLSVYLALLLGEDPTPVDRISQLKKNLEEAGEKEG